MFSPRIVCLSPLNSALQHHLQTSLHGGLVLNVVVITFTGAHKV